jgi:hypothetical protein
MPLDDMAAVVEDFITKVFVKADTEERTVETVGKHHAATFNTCSHFIALLTLFGQIPSDWIEKRKD